MKATTALQRYLERHIEPDLPAPPLGVPPWHQVLVIPVYCESPSLIEKLAQQLTCPSRKLLILVSNRPDNGSDPDINQPLKDAVKLLPALQKDYPALRQLNQSTNVFLYEHDSLCGTIDKSQGVGLARKIGCDIALLWQQQGLIDSDWICSTDADATLPADYFERLNSSGADDAAMVFPFWHAPSDDEAVSHATALYELRLHQYVLGLSFAGSPYAYHTLGSCIAIRNSAYVAVRGFPKRAGGEDFYLLNKAAKTGAINSPGGDCITLQSRASSRVPFGTGPAVTRLLEHSTPEDATIFYHPACFLGLRSLLRAIPALYLDPDTVIEQLIVADTGSAQLAAAAAAVLTDLGIEAALLHCRRQGKSQAQFLRQFHQWFDGFKTLKFIHGLRDRGWPEQPLDQLHELRPWLWPGPEEQALTPAQRRTSIATAWGWRISQK
ncbi:MAG: hypothetical protein V7746_11060 [Halioglobus sp.]